MRTRAEVCDPPLPAIVGREGVGVVVGFIESGIEAGEGVGAENDPGRYC
jgi:hypothetical protein